MIRIITPMKKANGKRMKKIIFQKKSLVVLLITWLCFCCPGPLLFSAAKSERTAKIGVTNKFGGGELRIVEGIPFLRLFGSFYEMGEQYGVLLKDNF